MDAQARENGSKAPTPPYVGWPSFRGMLSGFKEHVLPGRVDRSVLGNYSNIVGTQLLAALKFMGQIDQNGKPLDPLARAVAAIGTDDWKAELTEQLKRAYAPLFELDLKSASPAQFNEKFRASYPCEGDTLRKALTFFLNACREAEIPVSMFIMKNKKPRAGNGTRKPKPARAAVKVDHETQPLKTKNEDGNTPDALDSFKKELLGKFPAFDPTWPDNIKADWFKGFEQFMAMAKK
jgi:hypothetical protein